MRNLAWARQCSCWRPMGQGQELAVGVGNQRQVRPGLRGGAARLWWGGQAGAGYLGRLGGRVLSAHCAGTGLGDTHPRLKVGEWRDPNPSEQSLGKGGRCSWVLGPQTQEAGRRLGEPEPSSGAQEKGQWATAGWQFSGGC
jgi:hypothetical protein